MSFACFLPFSSLVTEEFTMPRLEGTLAINIKIAKVVFMIIDDNFGFFSDVFDDIKKHDITFRGGKRIFVNVIDMFGFSTISNQVNSLISIFRKLKVVELIWIVPTLDYLHAYIQCLAYKKHLQKLGVQA